MSTVPRHMLLKCKLNAQPQKWANTYLRDFFGKGNYPTDWDPRGGREDDITACLGMLALHHLGFAVPVDPREFLNKGVEVARDYFYGDWYQVDETFGRHVNKLAKDFEPFWFVAFSRGMLLSSLSQRDDDVRDICNWVEADLGTEYLGDEVEDELVGVYKSIAAGLRSKPMPGIEQLEVKIKKCRKLRPKLLFQAWDAARNKNQAAFDEAFTKSLEHFASTEGTGVIAIDWVAPHHSVVGLAARRYGLKWPELPPKLEAVLLSPESLGLA